MKVLEFFFEEYLKPAGGPAGYLYNLKKRRDELSDTEIVFLDASHDQTFMYRLLRKMSVSLKCAGVSSKNAKFIERVVYDSERKGSIDLTSYDIVHFHSSFDMYSQKKNLEDYKGIVVLTSHTPKVKYKEYIEDYSTPEEYEKYKSIFDKAEEFDRYAFKRADYVIFPCEGAQEPYFHTWDEYKDLINENKIRYVPTGIPQAKAAKSRSEIRAALGIAEDQFVVSYVGRHIPVKGYDRLISIFGKTDDITVVCCGDNGAITPPDSKNWIEIGWTSDPFSYVAASDLFVLPNRETYFDLALLEVLSLGKRSLISANGGNREFSGMEECGIYLFESDDEASDEIMKLKEESAESVKACEESQVKMFKERFTVEVFYDRYKEMLRSLIGS